MKEANKRGIQKTHVPVCVCLNCIMQCHTHFLCECLSPRGFPQTNVYFDSTNLYKSPQSYKKKVLMDLIKPQQHMVSLFSYNKLRSPLTAVKLWNNSQKTKIWMQKQIHVYTVKTSQVWCVFHHSTDTNNSGLYGHRKQVKKKTHTHPHKVKH